MWNASMRLSRRTRGICLIIVVSGIVSMIVSRLQTTPTTYVNQERTATDLEPKTRHQLGLQKRHYSNIQNTSGEFSYIDHVTVNTEVHTKKIKTKNSALGRYIPPRCSPELSIAFVKTHKAGSSTVANVLQRFGITHNLTFALPEKKWQSYGYNYISRRGQPLTPDKLVPMPNGSHTGYNILCNHAIYNRSTFREIMAPNTKYISILREPFQQFVSAFEYYGASGMFAKKDASIMKAKNPISTYLKTPYRFEPKLNYFSYVKNKQAEDLGMTWNEYFMPPKYKSYVSNLTNDFTLVMIMEYFDESLILLKRKLCWETKDILYITKNKNIYKPTRNFTKEDHMRHQRLSHLDYKLYNHFVQIFKAEIQKQNQEDFNAELRHFRHLLDSVRRACQSRTSFHTSETRWHPAFRITEHDCKLMSMPELAGLDLLLDRAGAKERLKAMRVKHERKLSRRGGLTWNNMQIQRFGVGRSAPTKGTVEAGT